MCDQISDAILDACLQKDPKSKVACGKQNNLIALHFFTETATKTGMVLVFGEITTEAVLDYQKIIRDTIKHIGYVDSKMGKQIVQKPGGTYKI